MLITSLILCAAHLQASAKFVRGRLYVVKGRAFVVGKPGAESQCVQMCKSSDTIEVAAHSVATVWLLGSGTRFQLGSPSTVKIVNGSVVTLKGVAAKPLPKLGSSITAVFGENSAQSAVAVRSPDLRVSPTGGLISAPEAISWASYPSAVSYDLSIVEENSSIPAVHVEWITGRSVTIPAGSLIMGKTYRMVLTANEPNDHCEMFFRSLRLITPAEAAALNAAEKKLDAEFGSAPEVQLAKADLFNQYLRYADSLACLTKLEASSPSGTLKAEIASTAALAQGRK